MTWQSRGVKVIRVLMRVPWGLNKNRKLQMQACRFIQATYRGEMELRDLVGPINFVAAQRRFNLWYTPEIFTRLRYKFQVLTQRRECWKVQETHHFEKLDKFPNSDHNRSDNDKDDYKDEDVRHRSSPHGDHTTKL